MLLAIKEEKDMIQVLCRLLTPSEQIMLGRRMQIAEKLVDGWTYHSIQEKLKVGVPTIRSIEKWLEDTARDYDQFRSKQRRQAREKQSREQSRTRLESAPYDSFTGIRRRYAGPFLLLNLLLDTSPSSRK